MGRFWRRQEESNHHFPEFQQKGKIFIIFKNFLTPAKATVLAVVLVFLVGFGYLVQTNLVATKGYKINEQEEKLAQLQETNKKLKLEYIKLQSMANIIDRSAGLNLVASNDLEVITAPGSAVALK